MFDEIAPVYDYFSWLFLPDIENYILNDVKLGENDEVLDVGGGTGKLIKTVLKENPRVKGYVLDRSRGMMERAPIKQEVIMGDSANLPFGSDSFDFVFCVDALHHFEDKNKSLTEMIRVSRPDGEIIILELDLEKYITRFVEYVERFLGEPSKFYEREYIKNIFLKNGFNVSIENVNFFQYILSAKKE
ncbi:MAG: methyltransferase domain-containing protein [Candidatus Thermoplasmatota archaeon]